MSSAIATILPGPDHLRLLGLCANERGILATLVSTAVGSLCPRCGTRSRRTHSRYVRHVMDLPWQGIAFRLELHVRRFFCDHAACAQRIFTERLPGIVAPSARTTLRLTHLLHQVAVALGGAAGRRLLGSMGVPGLRRSSVGVSRDTLLRLIRRTPVPTQSPLQVVGIDDFSLGGVNRPGGTILVDLERHRVVDLLGESTTTAAAAWLHRQPQIAILSRDRGESYAEAARLATPHALQVADRWHILHNLSQVTQAVFERHRVDLRTVAQVMAGRLPLEDAPTAESSGPTPPSSSVVPPEQTTRSPPPLPRPKPRQELFDQTKQLAAQGWSGVRIAQHLRLNRRTVRRYILADCLPEKARSPQTTSSLAHYDAYLLQRWAAGCHIGVQLLADLQEQGYRGGLSSVYRAMDRLQLPRTWPRTWPRKASPACPSPPPRKPLVSRPKSPRQAMWLLIHRPGRLTPEQEAYRAQLCAICPDAAVIYPLVQRLGTLMRERNVADLEAWLQAAEESGIPEFVRFARSLRRDDAAVRQALTSRWSQGQTEGFITKLKLLKRSMYGRAKIDLLRLRLVISTAS